MNAKQRSRSSFAPTNLNALWEGVQLRDEECFSKLHRQLYPKLLSYVTHIVKDKEQADDLLQDLFVGFWQKSCYIAEVKNIKSYFFRAARNLALTYLKNLSNKTDKLQLFVVPEIDFSYEEVIVKGEYDSELKNRMWVAVNRLPAKQKESIYLRFYENLDYKQIAEITGIRYQSVVNHVYRAVNALKEASDLKRIYAA